MTKGGSLPEAEESTARDAGGRVLLADDEPTLLRAYGRLLREAGYLVEAASDGTTAARLLAQSDFDVIVTDISMPGMDGVELLRRVRERDLDVPVVLMTGSPDVDTAVRAIEYGALRYLVKPVSTDELVTTVDRASRLHQMAKLKRQALALHGQGATQPGDRGGLEASLERALESLWMAYQPIVSWKNKGVFAFEALLRSSESTLPHPGAVLEAAERLDRLPALGRAIRSRVSADAGDDSSALLFVNLHPHDLLDDSLYDEASPLAGLAKRVVLEITERATLDGVTDVRGRLARLRELGFRIAVDDLGAGYAGLTSFAHLEPDVVKLDMSLIRDVHRIPTKQKLVRSMAALCHDMDVMVVAEGVETEDECRTLVECGCDLLQGYLFARPDRPFPSVRTWPSS